MTIIEEKRGTKNTIGAKLKRTVTAFLPVDKKRKGNCISCGACCKLPMVCPALRFNDQGKSFCAIYKIRPLNCRKYPRTASEHITTATCGIHFE